MGSSVKQWTRLPNTLYLCVSEALAGIANLLPKFLAYNVNKFSLVHWVREGHWELGYEKTKTKNPGAYQAFEFIGSEIGYR